MSRSNHVMIFDTTLRDGEQSPGASMSFKEKRAIARQLELLGVDVIEAGFPAASPGEVRSVKRISSLITKCQIAVLCRTREGDINTAWDSIKEAKHPRLHVFIATSDIHLEHKLRMTKEQVLQEVKRGVSHCREFCENVEFSAEDATRSDMGFLKEVMACAIEHGASVINIPDTVGYTAPEEYKNIVLAIKDVTKGTNAIISTHCHNDLGLAVANSLSAVKYGARQVECCINGIGERAGNAALEEVVMALKVRKDLFNCDTNVNTKELLRASNMVSRITGLPVQHNKSIIGQNAFAHEAGIHQHGMLHDTRTYEIMRPEDVGLSESNLVLGKHSGRAAFRKYIEELGYELEDEPFEKVFKRFKRLADKKKNVFEEDLHALIGDSIFKISARFKLDSLEFKSGLETIPNAKVHVLVDGKNVCAESSGDGPVNASIEAIKICTKKTKSKVKDYFLEAVTRGSDAQGRVSLKVTHCGITTTGHAVHTDIVVASARAFINALNNQEIKREFDKRKKEADHANN